MIFMMQHKSAKLTHNYTDRIWDLCGSGISYLYITETLPQMTLVSVYCVCILNSLLEDIGLLFFS